MRSIEYARAKGREARKAVGGAPGDDLLALLEAHLEGVHRVSPAPMPAAQMHGSRAEVNSDQGVLKYDASLRENERLMLLAHELGHLVLHGRVQLSDKRSDPLASSAYGETGPAAIARYSPRTYEETQAVAFALEFVAPSEMVWKAWCETPTATAASLAAQFQCTTDAIRAQLAHALHATALGGTEPSGSRKNVPFTDAQLSAARWVGAPAIVDAGPGTGKTATVVRRIQFLREEKGALPHQILALTFSNEAAQEMSERIASAFDADVADAVNVRTFHGFGVEFLHLHGHHLGLNDQLELLDEDRQIELVLSLLGKVRCDSIINLRVPLETAARAVECINRCKQRLIGVDAFEGAHEEALQLGDVFRAYEAEKWRTDGPVGRVDFADLIALPIRILEGHPDVRATYAERFPWVIVDECQDVTRATSRLLRALCGPANPPWTVGDARQSIYQFLGADPENVTAFARDFENAKTFALDVNYRSSPEIVTGANQLAVLLEKSDGTAEEAAAAPTRWVSGTATTSLGDTPVVIAEAATDAAEAEGVATQIIAWVERGVLPGEIAVVCRRHVDVRNVILALSRRGIKAQASGVLTAEGAAGDLAAMLTLGDAPTASIPRVAFALGRGRWAREEINATIGELLREVDPSNCLTQRRRGTERRRGLASEVSHVYEMLTGLHESADGFDTLAAVLFDDGAYLRRILDMDDTADRQMTLVEIVSVLSLATAYRATHFETLPAASRLGFAERLRVRLTTTMPVPLTPRPRTDAVHVMTCHASKGLEFSCVVVVGQTLPGIDEKWPWLPPALRPEKSRELAQADALLFVGVTRAKRAVVVSFPKRATAGSGGRGGKTAVPLLKRWRETFGVPTIEWTTEFIPDTRVTAGNLWSVPLLKEAKARTLAESECPLLSYVESYAAVRFPAGSRELYPGFFSGVRRSLRGIVEWAHQKGTPAGDDDARAMLENAWPASRVVDHHHGALYWPTAERMVVGFARAFRPMAELGVGELESETVLPWSDGLDVRLDLIARYRCGNGAVVAIAFRPESLGESADQSSLNWSELSDVKRSSIALLELVRPGVTPYVYSGRDERMYQYRWSKMKKSLPTLGAGFEARRAAFAAGDFSADVDRYQCDRCRVRASCPRWIGALPSV